MYWFILQEDLISFIDFRTMKVKQEEQFKYEVCLKRRFPESVLLSFQAVLQETHEQSIS